MAEGVLNCVCSNISIPRCLFNKVPSKESNSDNQLQHNYKTLVNNKKS